MKSVKLPPATIALPPPSTNPDAAPAAIPTAAPPATPAKPSKTPVTAPPVAYPRAPAAAPTPKYPNPCQKLSILFQFVATFMIPPTTAAATNHQNSPFSST